MRNNSEDWSTIDEYEDLEYIRETFQWRDREGHKYLLEDINDMYLQNIINLLKRRDPFPDMLIAFLEKEQETRKQEKNHSLDDKWRR